MWDARGGTGRIMIKVYYMDAAGLSDADFEKIYSEASAFRREKADAFTFPGARRLSLCASALLAEGLKEYGLAESELEYELGVHGKPAIKGHPEIHFSISHSVDKVMVCFAKSEVGCDIEKCEPKSDDKEVALSKRFFHFNEARSVEDNPELFYRYWTLKESFVKQSGKGLSMKLKDFEVILNEGVKGSNLRLVELETFEGYCAAICAEHLDDINVMYI